MKLDPKAPADYSSMRFQRDSDHGPKEITMFGKSYSDYLRFQMPLLIVITLVGLSRLGLSLSGMPDSTVQYASMTVVGLLGVIYYGLRVGPSGFGSYRHLLPLVFNQSFIANGIAILGIGMSAMGMPNIYNAVEFRGPFGSPDTSPMVHALAHLLVGNILGSLVFWGLASLVMLVAGRPKK
jgi:hypothetical protein